MLQRLFAQGNIIRGASCFKNTVSCRTLLINDCLQRIYVVSILGCLSMSNREFRIVRRVDYSQSGRNSRRRPLDSYSQAREPPRDSDDSSDETRSTQSESDNSTVVQHESDLESLSDLSEDFRRLKMENDAAAKKLFAAQESLRDDINDFIDENPINQLLTIDDVNTFVVKLEGSRSKYRNVHKEICNLIDDDDNKVDELKEEYEIMLKSIKVALADAKNVKIAMQNFEANTVAVKRADEERKRREEVVRKASSVTFLFVDVDRLLSSINDEIDLDNISTDRNIVDDDELIEMRSATDCKSVIKMQRAGRSCYRSE